MARYTSVSAYMSLPCMMWAFEAKVNRATFPHTDFCELNAPNSIVQLPLQAPALYGGVGVKNVDDFRGFFRPYRVPYVTTHRLARALVRRVKGTNQLCVARTCARIGTAQRCAQRHGKKRKVARA